MKAQLILFFAIITTLFSANIKAQTCTTGQTGGVVWQDLDSDGVKDVTETQGVAGVTVTAYDCNGNAIATATTDELGQYTFGVLSPAPSVTSPIRVEFTSTLLPYLSSSLLGTNNQSNVQFVNSVSCDVNYGLINPAVYCQDNPKMSTPCYISGDPLAGGTSAAGDVMVSFDYSNSGIGTNVLAGFGVPQTAPSPQKDALGSEIGSTWGLAYHQEKSTLYAAAFVKRHVGIGPLGEGGIYRFDYSTSPTNPVITNWLDVNTIGISTGTVGIGVTPSARNIDRGLNANATTQNGPDADAFDKVGKVGLGDIDISEDGQKLWVINLSNKTLNAILIDSDNNATTLPTSADVSTFTIPDPCGSDTHRPFAVKVHNGSVYVGLVCESATQAYIYKFDGSVFTPVNINGVADIPLTYTKGQATASGSCAAASNNGWFAWTTTPPAPCAIEGATELYARPTPMLSDIEFDNDGSLILGFMDRAGHQYGANNTQFDGSGLENVHAAGDILRVCRINNQYVM